MKAYKGFNKELTSCLGDGNNDNCKFTLGETKEVNSSKTASSGFHCCENPFECLKYYAFNGENRFFIVEAEGDIDEDEQERIACTKITIKEELTPFKFALEGMAYIINHSLREKWQQDYFNVKVCADKCEAKGVGHIAIARGKESRVKGVAGSILGLILEDDIGIKAAKLIVAPVQLENKWLTINNKREVVEV